MQPSHQRIAQAGGRGSWSRNACSRLLPSLLSVLLAVMALLSSPLACPASDGIVVELLRLQVPAQTRQAWVEAELASWEPWLQRQDGFLGRQLFWDPVREEGTLLIRWASRDQWKAIPADEVDRVQQRFVELARRATDQPQGNPFPLIDQGELQPLTHDPL